MARYLLMLEFSVLVLSLVPALPYALVLSLVPALPYALHFPCYTTAFHAMEFRVFLHFSPFIALYSLLTLALPCIISYFRSDQGFF